MQRLRSFTITISDGSRTLRIDTLARSSVHALIETLERHGTGAGAHLVMSVIPLRPATAAETPERASPRPGAEAR